MDDNFITFRNGDYIKTWIGQASGVTVDTVIMVTSSVERQMTEQRVGRVDYGGWVGTDYWENEKYQIPIRKLFEAMFYMLAYNKSKARIVSIYDPRPLITAVVELLSNKFDDGIPNGLIVYKPWFDYENDRAVTLVNKPKTQLKHAWYRWCWNAEFNDNFNLGDMEAYFARTRSRWKPARFGPPNDDNLRRYAYDNGIEEIDRIYNDFIVDWGGGGGGQQVLDSIVDDLPRAGVDDPDQEPENEASTLNNPLIEFERIDEVFTAANLRNVVQNFVARMNGDNYNYNVNLPIDSLVSSMTTAFATEKQRGVKRGVVTRVLNDQITVQWELPYGVFDANPVPVEQMYTKSEIHRNHRKVAAFLLTKIGRTKNPINFDTEHSLADHLRSGNVLNWSSQMILTVLNDSVQRDFVTFEIDLTTIMGDNGEVWDEEVEDMLKRFVRKVELINTDRPCDGRRYRDPLYANNDGRRHVWSGDPNIREEERPEEKLTVSKEVKRELDSIKNFFTRDEDVGDLECVNRYCRVVQRGTNF